MNCLRLIGNKKDVFYKAAVQNFHSDRSRNTSSWDSYMIITCRKRHQKTEDGPADRQVTLKVGIATLIHTNNNNEVEDAQTVLARAIVWYWEFNKLICRKAFFIIIKLPIYAKQVEQYACIAEIRLCGFRFQANKQPLVPGSWRSTPVITCTNTDRFMITRILA